MIAAGKTALMAVPTAPVKDAVGLTTTCIPLQVVPEQIGVVLTMPILLGTAARSVFRPVQRGSTGEAVQPEHVQVLLTV